MIVMSTIGKDGRTHIIVGLSHGNLNRLKEDGLNGYIKIDSRLIEAPVEIIITAGATEDEIAEAFKKFVGPNTKVTDKRQK